MAADQPTTRTKWTRPTTPTPVMERLVRDYRVRVVDAALTYGLQGEDVGAKSGSFFQLDDGIRLHWDNNRSKDLHRLTANDPMLQSKLQAFARDMTADTLKFRGLTFYFEYTTEYFEQLAKDEE